MSELPAGWAEARLPEMIAGSGVFNDGDWVESKDQDPEGDVRLIQLADVGDGSYRNRSARFLTYEKSQELGCTYLEPGDVLIARMPDPLGRACIFPGDNRTTVTVVDVCVVRPGEGGVDPRWLVYALNAPQTRRAIAAYQKGTTRKRISRGNLALVPFLVPPLTEQKRIVAAIEQQFSRLDAGLAALERAHTKLRLLRDQGILSLIEGTAPRETLGEVTEIRLGRQRSPSNHSGPDMQPYLRAANVTWSGLDLTDVKEMNFSPSELARYSLRIGDVLVSEASGSATEVGKPAIWDGSIQGCCFQNTLLRVRSDRLTPDYLYFVLLALARSGTFARASKGVGIHHLSKARLAGLEVEVPLIADQQRLVYAIRIQQERIAALDSALATGLRRTNRLRSSVLFAAFSGALVAQEPDDEPATVLLAQIASDRTASRNGRTKKTRRATRKATL